MKIKTTMLAGLMALGLLSGGVALAAAPSSTTATTVASQQAVNVNSASLQQLTAVKGLGPKKAAAVLAYKKANGSFKTLEDLTKVKGIGPGILAKLKGKLTV